MADLIQRGGWGAQASQLHEWFEKRPVGNAPAQCADGYYTFTGAVVRDDQWRTFCKIMEREDLQEDPRFATFDARRAFASNLPAIVDVVIDHEAYAPIQGGQTMA